jgi:hypothetical protein
MLAGLRWVEHTKNGARQALMSAKCLLFKMVFMRDGRLPENILRPKTMRDEEIMQLAKDAGLDLDPTRNMLIEVSRRSARCNIRALKDKL